MNEIICGDALAVLRTMPDESVNACVTSPPYFGLRDYSCAGQLGLEDTPELYIGRLTEIFSEVRRLLKPDGTCWVNIADSYAGSGKGAWDKTVKNKQSYKYTTDNPAAKMPKTWAGIKPKDMLCIPYLLALSLREDGWYLRQDILWHKPNAMPESVTDRCTKSHEYLFLLSKSKHYYFDYSAIKEPCVNGDPTNPRGSKGTFTPNKGRRVEKEVKAEPLLTRRRRSVWSIPTKPNKNISHFAAYPIELITPCILAGCPADGVILDPFAGSGTTGAAAVMNGRNYICVDLNPAYCEMARERIAKML